MNRSYRLSAISYQLVTGLLAFGLVPHDLRGQTGAQTHLLLVTGLSGEARFAEAFRTAAALVYDAAKSRWGVADSSLSYLAEDAARDPKRISGKATRERIGAAFQTLTRRSVPGDVILILLIGHGSGQGEDSRLSLPGPDATAGDFATWLTPLDGRTVVVVNAGSGSGDFGPLLAAPGRVVITATKSAFERNEVTFPEYFARGLSGEAADADKNGRVTILEAFQYARREVARGYETRNRLATEHPQLSDSTLARTIAFGTAPAPSDPRIAALFVERTALEGQVDALRRRKGTLDSLAYERELERLLLEIASKTAAIRTAEGRKP